MHVSAIVLAAGRGLRLKLRTPKPLVKINSKALVVYCLDTLSSHPLIKDIIVAANPKNLKAIGRAIKQYRIKKVRHIVLGGRLRQDSVANALKAVDKRADLVLIHDAVRPFISKEAVSAAVKTAAKYGAGIVGVPVKATIKKISGKLRVEKTLDRKNLWEIQTPQVFKKDLLLKAYKKFANHQVTDDAMLLEKSGVKVRLVLGSYFNIKVTTPEDLILAEAISRKV